MIFCGLIIAELFSFLDGVLLPPNLIAIVYVHSSPTITRFIAIKPLDHRLLCSTELRVSLSFFAIVPLLPLHLNSSN